MSEIIPQKLYLGSIYDATDTSILKSLGITDVITVITGYDVDMLSESLKSENIKHHVFDLRDTEDQNMSDLFSELFGIIDVATTTLVHCGMGISRSATVVLGYLMYASEPKKTKMYLNDATRLVLAARPCIFPNDGFIVQLFELENKLFKCMTFLPNADGISKYKRLLHGYI